MSHRFDFLCDLLNPHYLIREDQHFSTVYHCRQFLEQPIKFALLRHNLDDLQSRSYFGQNFQQLEPNTSVKQDLAS